MRPRAAGGGNPTTRYKWELKLEPDEGLPRTRAVGPTRLRRLRGESRARRQNGVHGADDAVAKDATSVVSGFEPGPQEATAPELPDAEWNQEDRQRHLAGPPTRTSVRSTVEHRAPRADDSRRTRPAGERLTRHPRQRAVVELDAPRCIRTCSYDELLEKTLAYAAAIRRADPEARIAGPAEWLARLSPLAKLTLPPACFRPIAGSTAMSR